MYIALEINSQFFTKISGMIEVYLINIEENFLALECMMLEIFAIFTMKFLWRCNFEIKILKK